MKKTLIALAAVAVTGAAFAQSTVTISGKYAVGYGKGQGADTADISTTDGNVTFAAVEDLGGGLKASVSMDVRVRGRGIGSENGVGGRNATVSLAGGFGSVIAGSVEAGNGIIGRGFAGAPIALQDGYDGAILSGPVNVDWFKYTSPELAKGLTVSYQRVDSIAAPGTAAGDTGDVFGVDYAAGPLSAGIDYTTFSTNVKRTRLSASYDLGMATVGFGFQDSNNANGSQMAFGVKVPMGAITAGLIYAKNDELATSAKGWAIGADYAFSKRTVLNVSYGDETSAVDGDQYRVRLMHSF